MNNDHSFVQQFQAGDRKPTLVTSNPLAQLLRMHLLEADAAGKAVLAFEPSQDFVQGKGVLQGGTVATMLDFALAFAALAALPADRPFATASLNVNMMKAALPGKYLASGVIDKLGSQVAFASAVLQREDDGQIIATATAVMPIARKNT